MIFRSAGTTRAEGIWEYKNGNWVQLAAGTGVKNFYDNGDADSHSDTSDFSTGNNPTFDGGGTLAGTFSLSTSANDLIDGKQVFKLVGSATAANNDDDYVASEQISIPLGYRGRTLGIQLQYKWDGTDDYLKWCVKDSTNSAILSDDTDFMKQHDSSNTAIAFSMSFFCPADCEAIEIGPQIITGEVSKTLIWDEVIVTPDPFVYKDLVDENVFSARVTSADVITSQNEDFISTVTSSSTGLYVIVYETNKFSIAPSVQATAETNGLNCHITAESATGCTVNIEAPDGTLTDSDFSILVQRQGSDYGQTTEHVVTPAKSTLTDWDDITLTATGFGTPTSLVAKGRRTGDSLEVEGSFVMGTPTAVSATLNLPSGYVIDTSKISGTGNQNYLGAWVHVNNTNEFFSQSAGAGVLFSDLTDTDSLFFSYKASSDTNMTKDIGSNIGASGNGISFNFKIPIQGWDSNATFLAAIPVQKTAYLKDVKSSGTPSGTFTSGAWQTRTLNTVEGDSEIVSLSSNQFTLGAGKYEIEAIAPTYDAVQHHKCKLRDISNSADVVIGSSEYQGSGAGVSSKSLLKGQITITNSTTFELQHYCTNTVATNGFGIVNSIGVSEIYAQVKITKIK